MADLSLRRTSMYLALACSIGSINCGDNFEGYSPTSPTNTIHISGNSPPIPDPDPLPPDSPIPAPPVPTPPNPPPPQLPNPPPIPGPSTLETLIVAGDVNCIGGNGAEQTARIIERYPNATVAALGDLTYLKGDYTTCYNQTWGRFKHRTKPAAGNHDYENEPQRDARTYFEYFGAASVPPYGFYSYNLGNWHIIVLNSEIVGKPGDSAMRAFLINDLRANRTECTLAYFHHPPFSSGNNIASWMRGYFDILDKGGVDVLFVAHEHIYERFAPQNASGQADPTGIRQFTFGTAGGVFHSAIGRAPNSERVIERTWGVGKFGLGNGTYSAQFIDANGGTLDDVAGRCQNPLGNVPNDFQNYNSSKPWPSGIKFTPGWR